MEEKQEQETEEQKKKRTRNFEKQVIVLFIVLGLIFASFLAVSQFMKPSYSFKYYGMTIYMSKIKGTDAIDYIISLAGREGGKGEILLRNDPRKLNGSVQTRDMLSGITKAWITMGPKSGADMIIAGNDLGIFTTRIGLDTDYALTEETEGGAYSTITCENATNDIRVFLIETGNETKVYEKDKCIIISGASEEETIKAADALVLHWLLKIKQ